MTTSMPEVDAQPSKLKAVFSGLLGRNVASIERIGGGRNGQVYRLTCGNSGRYAAKFYFRHSLDDRDRLEAEFSGLRFLWENGVRCVPRPIAVDRDRGCAVYEYIDGTKILPQEVSDSDIDYAVQFLVRLNELKGKEGSRNLSPASEACFSVRAIVKNIDLRLNRLFALRGGEVQHDVLHEFLKDEFAPSLDEITKWCKSSLNQLEMSFHTELPYQERTLSPSDFGFHNGLRRGDDQIVFLDFEYFGWDDPAKMISDFLLHPAMDLREDLSHRFVSGILSHFENHRYLARRVEIVYPLFGLKWCMIFLNEFVPEHLLRREFAGGSDLDRSGLQVSQLSRARRMLHRIINEYECFPYHG